MEILTDNYIWIIAIVVVILMTIIGYIAEKTNFGKKEFSKKKIDKKVEEPKEPVRETEKKVEVPETPTVEAPKVEEEPKENIKEMPKESEETVQFADPLADDMNVSSEVLETPYEEPRKEDVLSMEENLNVPFGETTSYDAPVESSFDVAEDLNAPFGDFEIPVQNSVEEDLNAPLSETSYNSPYEAAEEDLNAPFGDNAEVPSREEFNLNLPDIDSIKEDVSTAANGENDDDDIWKF